MWLIYYIRHSYDFKLNFLTFSNLSPWWKRYTTYKKKKNITSIAHRVYKITDPPRQTSNEDVFVFLRKSNRYTVRACSPGEILFMYLTYNESRTQYFRYTMLYIYIFFIPFVQWLFYNVENIHLVFVVRAERKEAASVLSTDARKICISFQTNTH